MSERTSFYRKVAYGVAIAVLLFPLALLSSPATVNDKGGKLAQMRTESAPQPGRSRRGRSRPAKR